MSIAGLDHCTIIAADLDATRGFYVGVLGLREGPRPPFNFPGAWFYCGAVPIVHVVTGRKPKGETTGPIDHIAMRAERYADFVAGLKARGIPFEEKYVPDRGSRQVFLKDPDGIRVELNFDP